METTYLKEFIYLANSLSFSRTADHFFVSKSVISRHLSSLEDSIGAQLVTRSNRSVELTEAGEIFFRDALVILRDCAAALEHISQFQESPMPIVRIGYLRNAARPVIVKFVRYTKEHCRDMRLSLTCMEYADLRRAMKDGSVDIALAVNVHPDVSQSFRSTTIYTDRFYAVMDKGNEFAKSPGVCLADLPQDRLLLPDSLVYAGLGEFIDSLVEAKTQLIARAYYSDMDMLYLKVLTEGYIALSSGLNNGMFGSQVAIVPLLDAEAKFTVSAFYSDELEDDLYHSCRAAFEACRNHANTDYKIR